MKVVERAVYLGPSLYAHFPVIRFTVDLQELEDWPSTRLGDGFVDLLLEALPGLYGHGCSYGEPGGFVRRLKEDEGTWLGHILEHVAIELQNTAGESVTFGKTRGTGEHGIYHVVFQYTDQKVGMEAGRLALKLLQSLLPEDLRTAGELPDGFVWEDERDAFIRFAQKNAFGPSTAPQARKP